MIRTIYIRRIRDTRQSKPVSSGHLLELHPGRRAGRTPVPLASESGDTLIEVIISAALIAFVVIAVLTGLDSANRSTSLQRARSQADALAQQNEDELRAEPINKLSELKREKTVKEGNTIFTVVSTSEYKVDATGTASCTSSTPKADYLETVSTVTSPLLGTRKIVETGIISPPADSALIVQVQESGTALAGAKVVATGPAPTTTSYELETSANGCAIIAVPTGGEYSLNASKTGYVDPNGYANTNEDLSVTRSVYLPSETTAKEGYNLGRAAKLEVSFTGATPAEGDSFVAFNTGMSVFRQFGTLGTYKTAIEATSSVSPFSTSTIFPFTTPYTVYAGACEADLPTKNGQSSNPEVSVAPGESAKVKVPLAPINVKVLESGKAAPEKALQNATVRLEDAGCKTVREFKTTSTGALPKPGMPFGSYVLCVTATISGKPRKDTTSSFANNNASGVTVPTIYLSEEGKAEAGCP